MSYSIDTSILSYQLDTQNKKDNYFNFLLKKIEPQKLQNFIFYDVSYINDDYTEKVTGNVIITYMKRKGYQNLINSLFDKNRINFTDCPITKNFHSKFYTNLYNFFNLKGDEINVEIIDDTNFILYEYIDITAEGTPQQVNEYKFEYIIDSFGNIDDIQKIETS